MNGAAAEAFWQFTLETYARPGVATACIALQDAFGHDVNILLLALYAGTVLGRRLDRTDFNRLEQGSAEWRDQVTRPLRALRRNAKAWATVPEVAAFRSAVQSAEIDAERLAQGQLLSVLGAGPAESAGRDLGLANLATYAGSAADALAAAF
jgi:uncharacterized protein (TIGR02444 family)